MPSGIYPGNKGHKTSLETRARMSANHRPQSGNLNHNWKGGVTHPKCIDCGKTIKYKSTRCLQCAGKHNVEAKIKYGSDSHFWRGGKSYEQYGQQFNRILKNQIRAKDGYKCKECGCPQAESIGKLAVHHIDYNKKNNTFINLVTLCRSCHAKTSAGNRTSYTKYYQELMCRSV